MFPRHLLEQLPDYLPKSARQVFDPSRGDAIAPLVHGDVNPSNVLGHLHYQAHVDEAMSYPGVLSVPPPPTFEPTAVIDFGDAQFSSDPLVDFVSVYVTILNCRKDLTDMVELLRESWQASFGAINPERLAQRCMWHVLLWPSEGLGMHLVRCVPEIGEMASWQQVEEAIFGWWKVSK